MPTVSDITVQVRADTGNFSAALNSAAADVARFGQTAERQAGTANRVQRALGRFASAVTGVADSQDALRVQAIRTERTLQRLGRRLRFTVMRLTSVRGALFSLAGAGGFGLLVRRAAEAGAQLQTQAELVGLSVEALQDLRFAAAEVGIGYRQADTAIQRFSRRVGEAASGGGVLAKVFEETGISIRDSAGNLRDVQDILRDYADVIQRASTQQERLRLAFAAFDTEGARLAAVLEQGAAGLDRISDRSEAAGRTSGRATQALTDLREQFAAVGLAAANAGQQLAAEFVPVFRSVASVLQGAFGVITRNSSIVAAGISAISAALVTMGVALAGVRLGVFSAGLVTLITQGGGVAAAFAAFARGARNLGPVLAIGAPVAAGIAAFTGAVVLLNSHLNRSLDAVSSFARRLREELIETFGEAASVTTGLVEAREALARHELRAFYRLEARAQAEAASAGRDHRDVLADLVADRVAVLQLTEEQGQAFLDYAAAIDAGAEALARHRRQQMEAAAETERLNAIIAQTVEPVEVRSDVIGRLGRELGEFSAAARTAYAGVPIEFTETLGLPPVDELRARRMELEGLARAFQSGGFLGGTTIAQNAAAAARELADSVSGIVPASRDLEEVAPRINAVGVVVTNTFRTLASQIVRGTATMRSAIQSLLQALAELALNRAFIGLLSGTGLGSALGIAAAPTAAAAGASQVQGRAANAVTLNYQPTVNALDASGVSAALAADRAELESIIENALVANAQADGPFRSALRAI